MSDETAPRAGERLARRAGVVAGFTLLSRVLGFGRDWVMAHVFGAGIAQDAFIAAQTIPYVLRRLVAEGSLMIAYIPLLKEAEAEGGLPAMRRFTAAVLGLLLPFLILLVGLGMLFPGALVELFSAGFDPERAELATALTRWMMPFLLFISLTAVASGALNARGVFSAPAAAPILLNLCLIAGALVGRAWFSVPIMAVGVGLSIGGAAQLLLQLPFLYRRGMLVGLRFEPRHPKLKTLLLRMGPAVLGVGVYQLNIIVIRQVASFLPAGQLSCYFLASRLQEFALGVFAVSVSIAALPTLSEHAAKGDAKALLSTYRRALRATNFITVPAAVGLFVMAEPIVGVMFRHGRFSVADAALTASLVKLMAVAVVPIGWVRITVPAYYALGDTKTPVWAALGSLITTALVGAAAVSRFEIIGLTAATLAAAVAQQLLLMRWFSAALKSRIGAPSEGASAGAAPPAEERVGVGRHMLLCALSVAPGALFGAFLAGALGWLEGPNLPRLALLFGGVLLVALSYLALAQLAGLPEAAMLRELLARRLPRRFRSRG